MPDVDAVVGDAQANLAFPWALPEADHVLRYIALLFLCAMCYQSTKSPRRYLTHRAGSLMEGGVTCRVMRPGITASFAYFLDGLRLN